MMSKAKPAGVAAAASSSAAPAPAPAAPPAPGGGPRRQGARAGPPNVPKPAAPAVAPPPPKPPPPPEEAKAERVISALFKAGRCEDMPLQTIRDAVARDAAELPAERLDALLARLDIEDKLMVRVTKMRDEVSGEWEDRTIAYLI